MIRFANEDTAPVVRQMWKTCFDDTDEFLDIYFSKKYKNENTLIYFEGDIAAASLQMLPYTINFYGENIPFAYLAGLCTLPQYRKRGYMAKLINEAHRIIADRNIHLAILIPAEEWLYGFYEKYGYEQVFEKDGILIPLRTILKKNPDIRIAYRIFDTIYRDKDFCVQKSLADFEVIAEDFKTDDCPCRTNLSGMARVINVEALLNMYARKNPRKEFRIKVEGEAGVYQILNGKVMAATSSGYDMEVSLRLLCRLLFGYKLGELDERYGMYFSEHHPIMNLMLE